MRHCFAPFGPEEVRFLIERTGIDYSATDFATDQWLCVSARDDAGPLMGVTAFEFKLWFDASLTIAVDDPRCVTRRVLRAMFRAVFSRAVRISAEVRPDNEVAIRLVQRMGFELEGYKRFAVEGRWDALQFGMTKDTCRFLKRAQRAPAARQEGISHGQLA